MNDVIRLILDASVVAKAILVILLFFSIVSWSIIIDKVRILNKATRYSKHFINLFNGNDGWEQLYKQCQRINHSPFVRLFKIAYQEFSKGNNKPYNIETTFQRSQPTVLADVEIKKKTAVSDRLNTAASREMKSLEDSLIFLATTASASPFLGLFGTVWGVMSAFLNIGQKGSAELSVVGPGVAEALVTTVAGLAVAIPAMIAYNYFIDRLKNIDIELQQFTAELIQQRESEVVL